MFYTVKKRLRWVKIISIKILIISGITAFVLFDDPSVRISAAALISKIKPISKPEQTAAKVWIEQDYIAMNRYFETLDIEFSPELIKAIAWCESEWKHFNDYGQTKVGINKKISWKSSRHSPRKRKIVQNTYDIGLMQINEASNCLDPNYWDYVRIQYDPEYNLQAGIAVLKKKQEYVRYLKRKKNWHRIERRYRLRGRSELEITIKAYNGFQSSWEYLDKINKTMAEKPWEKMMVSQMEAQDQRNYDGIEYVGGDAVGRIELLKSSTFAKLVMVSSGELTEYSIEIISEK